MPKKSLSKKPATGSSRSPRPLCLGPWGRVRTACLLPILAVLALASFARSEESKPGNVSVEGFSATFQEVLTPEEGWGTSQEVEWLTSFVGTLRSEKALTYRQDKLAPGTHDVWIEKGKGDWFHLLIGKKQDSEAPRLKAMFRLYEQEKGVKALSFKLKLTRKATKLKFSVFVGTSEGHGNLRIVEAPPKE